MTTSSVWAEVDLNAIRSNLTAIKKVIGSGRSLMAVVKANAYGHGLVEVAYTALSCGVNCFGVARVREGVRLRKAGILAPILILGYTYPEKVNLLSEFRLMPTVFSLQDAQTLSQSAVSQGCNLKVHLKIDSGMGRLGFLLQDSSEEELEKVFSLPCLNVGGIYTHFATADESDKTFADKQYQGFMELLNSLREKGINVPVRHAANSAALIDMDLTHLDMVRAGIAMYGHYPSGEVNTDRLALKPAMELKTRISMVKKVGAGFKVSYGATYETKKDTTLATISVGYGDGYSRRLSSKGEVLVHGQRARIVGRVCMDQCVIDVSHIPQVNPGDEVVLFGKQGEDRITVEEVAAKIGTISYEVLCLISERVPRIYLC